MALKDLFRRRRPVDTAALEAIEEAHKARDIAIEQGAQLRQNNDAMEDRVIRNHFGEAVAHSWAVRRAT